MHMYNELGVCFRIALFISVSFNLSNSRIFPCYAFIPFPLSLILVLFYRVSEEESLQVQYWVQLDEPLPLFLKRILKWEDTHTTHTTSLSLSLPPSVCPYVCVVCVLWDNISSETCKTPLYPRNPSFQPPLTLLFHLQGVKYVQLNSKNRWHLRCARTLTELQNTYLIPSPKTIILLNP